MNWFGLLSELTAVPGPMQARGGRDWSEARWRDRCEAIQRTPTGNLYARKSAAPAAPF